jgi:hypothetical protein
MIENEGKRKELKMLCVGMTRLIASLTARALHFVGISKSKIRAIKGARVKCKADKYIHGTTPL